MLIGDEELGRVRAEELGQAFGDSFFFAGLQHERVHL